MCKGNTSMFQLHETGITIVLKLILQPYCHYIVFSVFFVTFYEGRLFVEVQLVVGLQADMFVEVVNTTDPYRAL